MLTVAVLLGGASSEREVSLRSGQAAIDALDPQRYKVVALDPSRELARLVELAPSLDLALVMLHGRGGEDGSVQGLLDLLGVPYQCSGIMGCAIAMNKATSKVIFKEKGLPLAADLLLHKSQTQEAAALVEAVLPGPVVVKPVHEGSSVGISIVHDAAQLPAALAQAFALDEEVLVEEFLAGTELTCAVLGNKKLEPLPVIEIIPPQSSFFDYAAKYTAGCSQEICPARITPQETTLIQDLAIKAHLALGLKGYSRSDFILTPARGPVLLETNTVPGMTTTSLLPLAARIAGMDFPALVERLVQLALESKTYR